MLWVDLRPKLLGALADDPHALLREFFLRSLQRGVKKREGARSRADDDLVVFLGHRYHSLLGPRPWRRTLAKG